MEMFKIILTITTLIILCLIAIEDFCQREISIFWLACFFVTVILQFIFFNNWLFTNIAINLSILLFFFLIIKIYAFYKNGKGEKIINKSIGLGDVLIATIFSLVFSPTNFLLFLDSAFFIGILYYLVFKKKSNKVPLAGIFAVVYSLIILTSILNKEFTIIFQKDFFNLL